MWTGSVSAPMDYVSLLLPFLKSSYTSAKDGTKDRKSFEKIERDYLIYAIFGIFFSGHRKIGYAYLLSSP